MLNESFYVYTRRKISHNTPPMPKRKYPYRKKSAKRRVGKKRAKKSVPKIRGGRSYRRPASGQLQMLRAPSFMPQRMHIKCVKTWKIRVTQAVPSGGSAGAYNCNPQLMILNINSPFFVEAQYDTNGNRMKTELGSTQLVANPPDTGQSWDFEDVSPFALEANPSGTGYEPKFPAPSSTVGPSRPYSYDYLFTALNDGTGDKYKDHVVTGARFEAQFTPMEMGSSTAADSRQPGVLFTALVTDPDPLFTSRSDLHWNVQNFKMNKIKEMPYVQTSKFSGGFGGQARRSARVVQNYSPKMLNATTSINDNRSLWGHIDPSYTACSRPSERDHLIFGVCPYFDTTESGLQNKPIVDGFLEVKLTQTIKFSEPITNAPLANAPIPRVPGTRADRYVL